MSGNPGGPGKPPGGLPSGPGGLPQVSGGPGAPQNRVAPLAAAPLAAMAGLGAGPEGRNPSQHSELAALFECPVCFDYVLPPILQVSFIFHELLLVTWLAEWHWSWPLTDDWHLCVQCHAGHLVCSNCRPKLTCCPTCRGPLGNNIRNLAMEKVSTEHKHRVDLWHVMISGCQHGDVPLQVQLRRLHGHAASHGEDWARGDLWVQTILLPLPGSKL